MIKDVIVHSVGGNYMHIQTTADTGPLLDLLSEWTDLMLAGEYPAAWCRAMDLAAVALSVTDFIRQHHGGMDARDENDPAHAAEGLRRFLCMLSTACERAEANG